MGTTVPSESLPALESGLRQMFATIKPPNDLRKVICRVDNAAALKSMSDNNALSDIGVILDLASSKNKNSNPVAEKANQEYQQCMLTVSPHSAALTELQLCQALGHLN